MRMVVVCVRTRLLNLANPNPKVRDRQIHLLSRQPAHDTKLTKAGQSISTVAGVAIEEFAVAIHSDSELERSTEACRTAPASSAS